MDTFAAEQYSHFWFSHVSACCSGPIIETAPKEPIPETSLPLPHFLTLLGLSAWVVAADIAQDSFRCGSWQYWASQVSVLIPVVVILAVCRQILLR